MKIKVPKASDSTIEIARGAGTAPIVLLAPAGALVVLFIIVFIYEATMLTVTLMWVILPLLAIGGTLKAWFHYRRTGEGGTIAVWFLWLLLLVAIASVIW